MRRLLLVLVAGIVLAVLAGWLLVSAPFLGQLRAALAQGWLDRQAGGKVVLAGPLDIGLGQIVHVTAEKLTLHSPAGALAVARIEADLVLADLWAGRIDPDQIVITGARLAVLRDGQGRLARTTALPATAAAEPSAAAPAPTAFLTALAGKTIRLVDTGVSLQDQLSNFGLEAQLARLELAVAEGSGALSLAGEGTLNAEPVKIALSAAPDAPLRLEITSATTVLAFTGKAGLEAGLPALLAGQLHLASGDLGQTLRLMQLAPVLTGSAQAGATLAWTAEGDPTLTDIAVTATLASGASARITGALGNLRRLDDADIAFDIRLFAPGQEPPPAKLVKDLRLTSVEMTVAGPLKGDTRRSMTIATNGFTVRTAGVGPAPVQLAQISRGDQGTLQVGSLAIRIGPAAAPWLEMQGEVGDLLRLSGLALTAKADFALSSIVGAGNRPLPAALGNITGQFHVLGSVDALGLKDIDLATHATTLWSLALTGSVASLLPLEGVDLALSASLRTADMLKAMGQTPVDLAPLDLSFTAKSADTTGTVTGHLALTAGKSDLAVDLGANNRGTGPVVSGSVTSGLLQFGDLRDIALSVTRIADRLRNDAPARPPSEPAARRPVTRSNHKAEADEVQGITLALFDKDRLLRAGEVKIAVRIDRLAGKASVRDIAADLVVTAGKASFGPLKFAYGGGSFDLAASIDTLKAPGILRLKGATSGWDFGEIVKAMKVKYPASGRISAEFDLSGRHSSLADFIASLDGTATVRMKNGAIATQLLDLAGLGVLPWLFSKDRRGKIATLTCLRAPLEFENGVVATREAVVETPEVQLVAYGQIDLPRKRLNIAGQPRPVGKPLTRSPWPFTLSGALSNPKVKVKDGPARLRRKDGASRMPARRVPCVPDILQLVK